MSCIFACKLIKISVCTWDYKQEPLKLHSFPGGASGKESSCEMHPRVELPWGMWDLSSLTMDQT